MQYCHPWRPTGREKINGEVGGLNPPWEKGGPHWKHMKKSWGRGIDF